MDSECAGTSGGDSEYLSVKRHDLFLIMKNSEKTSIHARVEFLKNHLIQVTNCQDDGLNDLITTLAHFTSRFKEKWTASYRDEPRFIEKNKSWLDGVLSFKIHPTVNTASENKTSQLGRPRLPFEECCDRTKRFRCETLRSSYSVEELGYAAKMKLRASGYISASKIIENIINCPEQAEKYDEAVKKLQSQANKMSGTQALSSLVEAKLTTHQYNVIRASDPERFPSYKVVQQAKKECYPCNDSISVTETSAEVKLQALLNHTSERLIFIQREVISSLNPPQTENLCLVSKWGFDGSSGHSSYKQKFIGADADDASVFITSIVPLRLCVGDPQKKDAVVIWQNPRPSSTRFCRPLKICFTKESVDVSQLEKKRVDDEIKDLQKTKVNLDDSTVVKITHKLFFTMVDGKICNALTDNNSTQRCYICKATSKEFNDLDKMQRKEFDVSTLEFGLSILHCWIKCFECLLHIAYRLPIKKWQVKNEDKDIVNQTKIEIQKNFREKMGLIVDKPKPGFGNSNDGNTARRFFRNANQSSEITKVNKELIMKIHTILITVSSGFDINNAKFKAFCCETAKMYVDLYPWYYMPPTLHKLLLHGPEIVSSALLPIGQMSEEAQEARNKDFKKYREGYSRKSSRENTNRDVLNIMLITSDPVITSQRNHQKKKLVPFPLEVLELLSSPDIDMEEANETEEVSDLSDSDD